MPVVVQAGQITEVAGDIGRLIHLTWSKNRLMIDREHWMKSTGSKTDAEKTEDAIQKMIDRGIPEAIARKMADRRGGRGRGPFGGADFLTASSEGRLFTELKAAAGAMSGGGGGGGDEHHWDGHGGNIFTAMNTKDSTKDFRFMIRESTSPVQELLVEEHHEKGLRIQFSSPTRNLIFANDLDGVIHVAHTSKLRSEAFQVASYEQMLQLYPAFAAEFGTMLEQLGINQPLTDRDPRILNAIGKLVVKPDQETLDDAIKTIERLNDNSFQVRNEAEKKVAANYVAWKNVIQDKLADEGLASEVRMRLKGVEASSNVDTTEAEAYIKNHKLLQDVEYLKSVLDEMPDSLRGSVQQQIDSLAESE